MIRRAVLSVLCAALWAAGALAQIGPSGGGGGGVTGSFTAGDLLVANSSGQITDSSQISPAIAKMPVALNFTSDIIYSGSFSAAQEWLGINGLTLSGTAGTPGGDGNLTPFRIFVGSDTVDATTNGPGVLNTLAVTHSTAAGASGFRTAIQGSENVVGVPTGKPNYVGVLGITRASANLNGATGAYTNYGGGVFGMNANAFMTSGATFVTTLTGFETDVSTGTGASVAEKHGLTVILTSADVNRADFDDSAIEIDNQDGTSNTWKYGISFGSYAHKWPFGTDSTLIVAQQRQTPSTDSPVALNGVDFTNVTFQSGGCAYKSTGFCITPSGGVQVSGTTAPTNGMYLATAGVVSIAANSTANVLNVGTGFVGVNSTTAINSNDKFATTSAAAAITTATFKNSNTGSSAGSAIFLANDNSNVAAELLLNGHANSSGNGIDSFTIIGVTSLFLKGGTTNSIQIDSSGNAFLVTAASDSGATDATVCRRTSNGQLLAGSGTLGICLGTSSARYKHGIFDIDVGLPEIMKLRPVQYYLNADYGDPSKLLYGFIAEEGLSALPKLIGLDEEGRPNTFDYMGVMAPLVKAFQSHEARLAKLEKKTQ